MCKWPFAQTITSSTPEFPRRLSRPADQQCSSTDAGSRTSKLARRSLYSETATQDQWCTGVQMALCTEGHHIEHSGVRPRRLSRPADQQCSSTDAGSRTSKLARRSLYSETATQDQWCTGVQMAFCTEGHHIEHSGVRPRRLSRPADQQCSSTDAGCQDIETCQSLRDVRFILRRQSGYY